MSTTDLFSADFPHGSPVGFERGCRGAACPNHVAGTRTCKQAHLLYQSDYGYRRSVDAGVEYVEPQRERVTTTMAAHELVAIDAEGERCKCGHHGDVLEHLGEIAVDAVAGEIDAPPAAEPAPTPKAPKPSAPKPAPEVAKRTEPEHGTTARFSRGCKSELDCPGDPLTGLTCRQANRDYQREYARKRAAPESATSTPAAEQKPASRSAQRPGPSPAAVVGNHAVIEALKSELQQAKDTITSLNLELDVAKEAARAGELALQQRPAVEYRHPTAPDDAGSLSVPSLLIDPTEAGGVRVDLTGIRGPVSLSLAFAEHGLADVQLTVPDHPGDDPIERKAA